MTGPRGRNVSRVLVSLATLVSLGCESSVSPPSDPFAGIELAGNWALTTTFAEAEFTIVTAGGVPEASGWYRSLPIGQPVPIRATGAYSGSVLFFSFNADLPAATANEQRPPLPLLVSLSRGDGAGLEAQVTTQPRSQVVPLVSLGAPPSTARFEITMSDLEGNLLARTLRGGFSQTRLNNITGEPGWYELGSSGYEPFLTFMFDSKPTQGVHVLRGSGNPRASYITFCTSTCRGYGSVEGQVTITFASESRTAGTFDFIGTSSNPGYVSPARFTGSFDIPDLGAVR
jgi:hypothetical protein